MQRLHTVTEEVDHLSAAVTVARLVKVGLAATDAYSVESGLEAERVPVRRLHTVTEEVDHLSAAVTVARLVRVGLPATDAYSVGRLPTELHQRRSPTAMRGEVASSLSSNNSKFCPQQQQSVGGTKQSCESSQHT